MKKPIITNLKKYFFALKKLKKKYVTSEILSKEVGVYPEIISECFSYFDPVVNLDYQYNLMDLIDVVEAYIDNLEQDHEKSEKATFITKKKLSEYDSIGDFVYKKMTIGGIIDKNIVLSDTDLRALKRLINEEQAKRKANKTKYKK